eukprot:COSAG06_NODE_7353_length_2523_cov_2.003285_1_plen_30_part_10
MPALIWAWLRRDRKREKDEDCVPCKVHLDG